jgi:hypothetical protein
MNGIFNLLFSEHQLLQIVLCKNNLKLTLIEYTDLYNRECSVFVYTTLHP